MELSANLQRFYINGEWVEPQTQTTLEVINPATEAPIAEIAMGTPAEVDAAVAAAHEAFASYSQTSVEYRVNLLNRITELLKARSEQLAQTISAEMGAPKGQKVSLKRLKPRLG